MCCWAVKANISMQKYGVMSVKYNKNTDLTSRMCVMKVCVFLCHTLNISFPYVVALAIFHEQILAYLSLGLFRQRFLCPTWFR